MLLFAEGDDGFRSCGGCFGLAASAVLFVVWLRRGDVGVLAEAAAEVAADCADA